MRRTRWWVALPLALIYVFRPASFGGETLGTVLLLTAGLYLWAPVLFDVGQSFRRGYREADEHGARTGRSSKGF